jgi:hypothetical protein
MWKPSYLQALLLLSLLAVPLSACAPPPEDAAAPEAAARAYTESLQPDLITIQTGQINIDANAAREIVIGWMAAASPLAQESSVAPLLLMQPTPLQPGDKVRAYIDTRPGWEWFWETQTPIPMEGDEAVPEESFPAMIEISEPTWFFWADWRPYARFAHPGHFIFLGVESGTVRAYSAAGWPVINGEVLWRSDADRFDGPDRIFAEGLLASGRRPAGHAAPLLPPVLEPATGAPPAPAKTGKGYAIVVGGADDTGAHNDADAMERTLAGLGFSVNKLKFSKGASAPWRTLETAIKSVGAKVKRDDVVVFYFSGHGGEKAGNNKIELGGNTGAFSEFLIPLAAIAKQADAPQTIYIMLDSCFVGALMDYQWLSFFANTKSKIIISTSTSSEWAETTVGIIKYGRYSSAWLEKFKSTASGISGPQGLNTEAFEKAYRSATKEVNGEFYKSYETLSEKAKAAFWTVVNLGVRWVRFWKGESKAGTIRMAGQWPRYREIERGWKAPTPTPTPTPKPWTPEPYYPEVKVQEPSVYGMGPPAHTETAPTPAPTVTPLQPAEAVVTDVIPPTTTPLPTWTLTPTPAAEMVDVMEVEEEAAVEALTSTITHTPSPTAAPKAPPEAVEQCAALASEGYTLLSGHMTGEGGDCEAGIGLLRQAIVACDHVLAVEPNHADACYHRGMSRYLLHEDLETALADLNCALQTSDEGLRQEIDQTIAELAKALSQPVTLRIGPVQFAEGWSAEGVPYKGPAERFSGCVPEVWSQWSLENQGGERGVVKWFDHGEHACQHYTTMDGAFSYDWSGYFTDDGSCLPAGEYCMQVWVGPTMMTEGCFIIE